jgi:hypothetical protein
MALSQSNSHKFQSGELVTSTKLNNVKVVQTDNATNNNNFTGSAGQLTFDTTANKLRVHDGSTAGGLEVGAGGSGSVTSTEIASDAVITEKINDDAVTTEKINDDAVTTAKIADDAVGADQLDESQTYEVSGLHSNGANIQITRGSEGPGLRFAYDATTDEVRDIFVDSNGDFRFTNVSGNQGTTGTRAVISSNGALSLIGGGQVADIISASSERPSGYMDAEFINTSTTGFGCRIRASHADNTASLQYQASQRAVSVTIEDDVVDANCGLKIRCISANQGELFPTGSMASGSNSNVNLGSSGLMWDNAYTNGGSWSGSDRNIKQDIEDLDEAELRVASKLKGLMKKFRLKDAVEKKGDDARIHVGIIAQDVKSEFEAEGLDPYRYALIGEDTWWEKINEEGERELEYADPKDESYTQVTKMSVRYEELLAFIISAL